MNDEIKLTIGNSVVHILNTELQVPVLSDQELELSHELTDFIYNHLKKYIYNDVMKACYFKEQEDSIYQQIDLLIKDKNTFLSISKTLATELYGIMLKHVDIPSADVLFTLFECEKVPYLGILKMNYKTSYIHYVLEDQDSQANTIIKQRTALPNENQRLEEVILINLDNKEIKILEKKYDINGEKDFYLTPLFLKSTFNRSNKEKFDIVNNTLKSMNKKYFDADVTQSMDVKKAMLESVEETGVIDVNKVADVAFENNLELKQEFQETIQKKGMEETYVSFEAAPPKKIEKQVIKTDTGIEINIPMEQYSNGKTLEFLNNPDGTISIVIKNVGRIVSR